MLFYQTASSSPTQDSERSFTEFLQSLASNQALLKRVVREGKQRAKPSAPYQTTASSASLRRSNARRIFANSDVFPLFLIIQDLLSLLDSDRETYSTRDANLVPPENTSRQFSWSEIAQGLDDDMELDDMPPPSLTRLTMLRERLRQQRLDLGLEASRTTRITSTVGLTEPTLSRLTTGATDGVRRRVFTFVPGRGVRRAREEVVADDSDEVLP
jgi:hypothetical protein